MSPKFMIAACLVAMLLPVWLASIAGDLNRKGVAVGAALVTAAVICFFIGGLEYAIVAIGLCYGAMVLRIVAKAALARRARARLSDHSRPEPADLERWARKALRRQGWSVAMKTGPQRLVARKRDCTDFHLFCATDCAAMGSVDARALHHYAARTNAPVILLLFGGASPALVEDLRSRKILPVSQKDFLGHLDAATSRNAFVSSCRRSVIEEARFGLSSYAHSAPGLNC